mgnify:CR=1 FL=1
MPHVLFVTNPAHTSDGFAYVRTRFAQAAANRPRLTLEPITVDAVLGRVTSTDAAKPDAALVWDKDIATARLLEAHGVRCFNSPAATDVCENKLATYHALRAAGVPQPDTVPIPRNPLSMQHDTTPRWAASPFIDDAISALGLPMVGKPSIGSFGTNVRLIHTRDELVSFCTMFDRFYPGLVQRYVPSPDGSDVRVAVIGGHAVAAMKRTGVAGDFRANIALGGTGTRYELDDTVRRVAEDAARAVGTDVAGVDVLGADTDSPMVCEVNSCPQFLGLETACGIDFPAAVLDHIERALVWTAR